MDNLICSKRLNEKEKNTTKTRWGWVPIIVTEQDIGL